MGIGTTVAIAGEAPKRTPVDSGLINICWRRLLGKHERCCSRKENFSRGKKNGALLGTRVGPRISAGPATATYPCLLASAPVYAPGVLIILDRLRNAGSNSNWGSEVPVDARRSESSIGSGRRVIAQT